MQPRDQDHRRDDDLNATTEDADPLHLDYVSPYRSIDRLTRSIDDLRERIARHTRERRVRRDRKT